VASAVEIAAAAQFLQDPDHMIFVCPRHDIGEAADSSANQRSAEQLAEYLHHGDHAIPPRQGFGGFARSLLAGLGVPVENRFGLSPAVMPDGTPAPIDVDRPLDELRLLQDVVTFNAHPHLPQLERIGEAGVRMDVLARQRIDLAAPPHAFTHAGRDSFDALLQSRPETFAGKLLVCDTTLFSSTAGGVDSLRRFWGQRGAKAPQAVIPATGSFSRPSSRPNIRP
jgi:hypothetical protein